MFPGSLVVFQLSYVSAADDVGPCNAHPSLHLRGGAWQWEGWFGDPFKVSSHPWLVLIAQTVVEHLCVYVILIHHLRQFYSLSADLEKTRQALLIATVKLFFLLILTFIQLTRKMGTSAGCQKRWDMFTAWPWYGESKHTTTSSFDFGFYPCYGVSQWCAGKSSVTYTKPSSSSGKGLKVILSQYKVALTKYLKRP